MYDKDYDKEIDTDVADDEDDVEEQDVTKALVKSIETSTNHGATPLDLARLGLSEFAYIRRAVVNDTPMWTIHSAAGDPLGAAQSFELAWSAVKQNDLEPLRVH